MEYILGFIFVQYFINVHLSYHDVANTYILT